MSNSKQLPNYTKFLFAACSGLFPYSVAATLVCYPLDFVKTRMQVYGAGGKITHITSYQLASNIIKAEGPRSLYTGLTASILRQATYTGMRMGAFQTLTDYFTDENGPPNLMVKSVCGGISGALGGIAGLPADVALTRMAADGNALPENRRNYTHVFNAMGRIVKEEGTPVLFRGLSPTIVRAVLVNITQLVSYVQAKEILLNTGVMKDGTLCHLSCSVISALTATTCCLPADIAKTRMQNMQIIKGVPEYNGLLDVWMKIVTREGFFSLWKGFTPLFLRNGPQFVVLFVVYENLTLLYKQLVLKTVSTKS